MVVMVMMIAAVVGSDRLTGPERGEGVEGGSCLEISEFKLECSLCLRGVCVAEGRGTGEIKVCSAFIVPGKQKCCTVYFFHVRLARNEAVIPPPPPKPPASTYPECVSSRPFAAPCENSRRQAWIVYPRGRPPEEALCLGA